MDPEILSGYEIIVLDPVPAKSVGVDKYYRYCKFCIFFYQGMYHWWSVFRSFLDQDLYVKYSA